MGLPSGISKRGKKFQARLCYVPTGGTKKELRGVGTFVTVEEAVAALAEAQRKLAKGGALKIVSLASPSSAPSGDGTDTLHAQGFSRGRFCSGCAGEGSLGW